MEQTLNSYRSHNSQPRKQPLTIEIARVILLDRTSPITSKNSPVNRLRTILKKSPKSPSAGHSVNSSGIFLPRSASKLSVSIMGPAENLTPEDAKMRGPLKKKASTEPKYRAKTAMKSASHFTANGKSTAALKPPPATKTNNFRASGKTSPGTAPHRPETTKEKLRKIAERISAGILAKEQKTKDLVTKTAAELSVLEEKFGRLQQFVRGKPKASANV